MKTILKNITLMLALALSTNTFAGECFDRAKNHGKDPAAFINQDCKAKVEKTANFNQKRWSEDQEWMAVGYSNVLIARRMKPRIDAVIAGEATGLNNITATAIDLPHNEMYAFDSVAKSLMVFGIHVGGNVAPIRKYSSTILADTVSIAIDTVNNYVLVATSDNIYVFQRNADNTAKEMKLVTSIGKPIIDFKSISAITFDSKNSRFYVADSKADKLYQVELFKGQYTSHKDLSHGKGLNAPSGLLYDSKKDSLIVYNKDYTAIKIK